MPLSPLELMRNSIVCFEGKVHKVKAVSELILLEGRREWIGASLMNGEPISITWLEKFKFEQLDYDTWSNGKIDITIGDGCFYSPKIFLQYNYVHQLQLLHFALTGDHLVIPKLPK